MSAFPGRGGAGRCAPRTGRDAPAPPPAAPPGCSPGAVPARSERHRHEDQSRPAGRPACITARHRAPAPATTRRTSVAWIARRAPSSSQTARPGRAKRRRPLRADAARSLRSRVPPHRPQSGRRTGASGCGRGRRPARPRRRGPPARRRAGTAAAGAQRSSARRSARRSAERSIDRGPHHFDRRVLLREPAPEGGGALGHQHLASVGGAKSRSRMARGPRSSPGDRPGRAPRWRRGPGRPRAAGGPPDRRPSGVALHQDGAFGGAGADSTPRPAIHARRPTGARDPVSAPPPGPVRGAASATPRAAPRSRADEPGAGCGSPGAPARRGRRPHRCCRRGATPSSHQKVLQAPSRRTASLARSSAPAATALCGTVTLPPPPAGASRSHQRRHLAPPRRPARHTPHRAPAPRKAAFCMAGRERVRDRLAQEGEDARPSRRSLRAAPRPCARRRRFHHRGSSSRVRR